MSLADKIRKSRETQLTVGEATFNLRRATTEEMYTYYSKDVSFAEICRKHVTGWSGVKESDLIDDGKDAETPFNRELFCEIIGDRPEWFSEIAKAVLADAIERVTARIENEKK